MPVFDGYGVLDPVGCARFDALGAGSAAGKLTSEELADLLAYLLFSLRGQ
jgi:hypothetical protein